VCQGTIEYIKKPDEFLEKIKKYGQTLIITYRLKQKKEKIKTENNLTFGEFKEKLKKHWEIICEKNLSKEQKLFYCRKK
jgi:hypothetical protein